MQAQVLRQILQRSEGPVDGERTLTLKLEPEHLGRVEVRLSTSGEQLLVEFQAESAEAGAALRQGRHELVRALVAQAGRWQQVEIRVAEPERIEGQRVLVIEDGPTVTHGGMSFGAGTVAARRYGATIVDPRPYAVGTIRDTFAANPHLDRVLPAMGYSHAQRESLQATINDCCEAENVALVVDASPARLDRLLDLQVPLMRVDTAAGPVDALADTGAEGFFLSPETWAEVFTPAQSNSGETLPYGLGWFIEDYEGQPMLHHGGNIDGFSALVTLFPRDGAGVVVLVNRNGSATKLAVRIACSKKT